MKRSSLLKSGLVMSASAVAAQSAHSEVIFSGPLNLTNTYNPDGSPTLFFDLNDDTTPDYQFIYGNNNRNKPELDGTDNGSTNLNRILLPVADEAQRTLPVLPVGTIIGPDLFNGESSAQAFFYLNSGENYYGDWGGPGGPTPPDPVQGPIEGYVGLVLDNGDMTLNYGYAHFVVDVPGGQFTLLDTAYETTPDTPITVVPEPTTLVLLAAGAAATALLRRRKKI